jgi:pilus assembly protein CpaB
MVDPAQLVGTGRVAVPAGLQEVTVKLSMDRMVGGNIRAGDTVGVILSFPEDEKRNVPDQSQLIFHKVMVTAVQNATGTVAQEQTASTEKTSDGSLGSKSSAAQATGGYMVTLARNSVDVEKIVHAVEFGTVYLSKESASTTTDSTGVMERVRVFQ